VRDPELTLDVGTAYIRVARVQGIPISASSTRPSRISPRRKRSSLRIRVPKALAESSGGGVTGSSRVAASFGIRTVKARHLATETIRKYLNLLERRFVTWCESKGYRLLKQIDVGAMREFRTTWDDGPVYASEESGTDAGVLPVL